VIFLFLATYGALMILLLQVYLPESLPVRQSLHPMSIARNYALLISDARYLAVTTASGLIYSGLMAYLSSSSFVYIEMLGVPVHLFGFIFLSTVAGYMGGSALSARLASRHDSPHLLMFGTLLCLLATGTMWAGATLRPDSVLALMLPMTLYSAGMGLVLPHAMAIALAPFPHIAGTASSLLGFIQMGLSSSAAALVGQLLDDSAQPMLAAMFAMSLACLVLAWHPARNA
jgi:DHA1 family bicyclomycin/chloramphenicol resistance-like MFS transporter